MLRLLNRSLSIEQGAVVLATAFMLSTMMGVVRQALFNALFGVGPEANAYIAAFRMPDLLFKAVAVGALSNAMIPVMVRVAREQGSDAEWHLTNLVLSTLLAFFVSLIVLAQLVMPAFVSGVLAPGFDAPTTALTVRLARIIVFQPLILAWGSVAIAVLNSRHQFLLTGLSIISNNFALIGGILLVRAIPSLGIYGPTGGVLVGALLQVLILVPGLRSQGFRFRPAWNLRDRSLRLVLRLLGPNSLSVAISYAGSIVDTSFASRAPEAAALAAIYNANLLIGLPIRLLGQATGQAAFPRLAAHGATADWALLRRTLRRTLVLVVLLSLPAMLLLLVGGRVLIRVVLEHGAFDAVASALTYAVLVPLALGLPAYVATDILTRGLLALHDTTTPLLTNTAQLLGRIGLCAVLLPQWGAPAIPIAFAVTSAAETGVLAAVLWWKLRRNAQRRA
jgi:putative peptidoglycan lipid II flippase